MKMSQENKPKKRIKLFEDECFMGVNIRKAYEAAKNEPEKPKSDKLDNYLKNYILLPQNNEHPDLIIAKNRLSYNTEVEQAAKKLSLNLKNNSQDYIGNINFDQSHNLLEELGSFMLNPKLFTEFLKLLKSGNAIDGNKNKINSNELETILKGITELRDPFRREWLDHKYSQSKNKLLVTYHKFDSSGKLIKVTEALDSDTLMEDKTPGMDLEDWINNRTSQGLPKSNVSDGSLYFLKPTEESVTRFDAYADWAVLFCNRDPLTWSASLGVREVKIFRR